MKSNAIVINNFDNHILLNHIEQSNLIDHVPAMVYKAMLSPNGIVLIKDRKRFDLPSMRYGKHKNYFKRITSSYDRLGSSIGVMLSGVKGTGKSLLAEEIGNWMISQDIPVISIGYPIDAADLMVIIRGVGPCMVYFDEFGKIYGNSEKGIERREMLLPLFSDTSLNGVIFVITGNEGREFSNYLLERPQRFRFFINYNHGVSSDVAKDVIETMKVPERFHDYLYYYASTSCPNVDSFLCVVRETADCKDIEELADRCEILNVGSIPLVAWRISNVEKASDNEDDGNIYWSVEYDARKNKLHLVEGSSINFMVNSNSLRTSIPVELPEVRHDCFKFRLPITGKRTFVVEFSYGFETNLVKTSHSPSAEDGYVDPPVRLRGAAPELYETNNRSSSGQHNFFEGVKRPHW